MTEYTFDCRNHWSVLNCPVPHPPPTKKEVMFGVCLQEFIWELSWSGERGQEAEGVVRSFTSAGSRGMKTLSWVTRWNRHPISSKKWFPRISTFAQNTSAFWDGFVKMHCGAVRNISNETVLLSNSMDVTKPSHEICTLQAFFHSSTS